jgi:methionine-rich copper-binding protein CopC
MLGTIIARRLSAAALVIAPALVFSATGMSSPQPSPARFHLARKRAEPAVNDTVTASPKTITLWFTESVSAATTGVRLLDAQDHMIKVSDVSVDAVPLSPAIVTVPETLRAGTYTVMWRAMADDGHPSTGKFSFTVK